MCIALRCDELLINCMDSFKDSSMVQGQCLRTIGALAFGNDVVGNIILFHFL
jgi:hypothetical protein